MVQKINSQKNQARSISFLIGASVIPLILYALCFRKYYTGYFIDDSMYLLMAKSLLQGHYRALFSPLFEPILTPWPGYPLLLAPLIKIFNFWDVPPKFLSILFTIGTAITIYRALNNQTKDSFLASMGFLVFAFNAVIVQFSSTILSEPAFMFFSILGIHFISKQNKAGYLWAGALVGLTLIMRPQSVFLLASILLVLLIEKNWAGMKWLGVTLLPFVFILIIHNQRGGALGGSYFSIFSESAQHQFNAGQYWENLKAALGVTFPDSFLNLPFPSQYWARKFLAWAINLSCLFVMAIGLKANRASYFSKISLGYIGITLFTIPLWHAQDPRYFYILLPFITVLFLIGTKELAKNRKKQNALIFTISMGIIFLQVPRNIQNIKTGLSPNEYRGGATPFESFNWIRENTSKNSQFLCIAAPTLFLYTNRKTITYFPSKSPEAFANRLNERNIHYILIGPWTPPTLSKRSPLSNLAPQISEIVKKENLFHSVYVNEMEGITIYKLKTFS